MLKSPCRFLLPLAYNDGTPLAPEKLLEIKMALDRQFGGCRFGSPSEGVWQGQVEGVMEIEVAVLPKRIPELRAVVKSIGRDLQQICMYFDAPLPSVEIIDTDAGTEDEDET